MPYEKMRPAQVKRLAKFAEALPEWKRLRKALGMSQGEAATFFGVSRQNYNDWETNKRAPRKDKDEDIEAKWKILKQIERDEWHKQSPQVNYPVKQRSVAVLREALNRSNR